MPHKVKLLSPYRHVLGELMLLMTVMAGAALFATAEAASPHRVFSDIGSPTATWTPTETHTPVPVPTCGLAWRIAPGSVVGPLYIGPELLGVAAISSNDVWAVGEGQEGTLTMHWNGYEWQTVPSPHPSLNAQLYGVSAASTDDVWAVGAYYAQGHPQQQALIMHWDGSIWSLVPTPDMGTVGQTLQSVAAVSSEDVWAVGWFQSDPSGTLILHWNGAHWEVVPSPSVPSERSVLYGITAISARDVWAVGYVDDVLETLTLHWDGVRWTIVPSPDVGIHGSILQAVSAASANDVWAAGYSDTVNSRPLVLHWNGQEWRVASASSFPAERSHFRGIEALAADDVWAVGAVFGDQGFIMHWDGANWTQAVTPNVGRYDELFAGASLSSRDLWAVGMWYDTQVATLALHYTDPCSSPTPTLTPFVPSSTPTLIPIPTYTSTATPTPSVTLTGTPLPPTTTTSPSQSATPGAPPTHSPTAITPTPTATACTLSFSDVFSTDYFYDPVRYLLCRGVISGYADGTFKPYNTTTRGQLTKIIVLAQGWPIYTPSTPTFRDVPTTDPFHPYVETAYAHAIISGYTCGQDCLEFRPGNSITRAQLCKVVVLARGWALYTPSTPTFRDVPPEHSFYTLIETAYTHRIISGYSCGGIPSGSCLEFLPASSAARGQIAKIVYQAATGP